MALNGACPQAAPSDLDYLQPSHPWPGL